MYKLHRVCTTIYVDALYVPAATIACIDQHSAGVRSGYLISPVTCGAAYDAYETASNEDRPSTPTTAYSYFIFVDVNPYCLEIAVRISRYVLSAAAKGVQDDHISYLIYSRIIGVT